MLNSVSLHIQSMSAPKTFSLQIWNENQENIASQCVLLHFYALCTVAFPHCADPFVNSLAALLQPVIGCSVSHFILLVGLTRLTTMAFSYVQTKMNMVFE